ncbi:MAG: NADH-quinone oxidoreductase subunit C [Gammaproteobacteria bacterium]|nr:NADH-quinone oxidoreductase subunit C [Gammaproteobacteria bacterium]
MQTRLAELAENLIERFADLGCEVDQAHAEVTLVAPPGKLLEVATALRDEDDFLFEELIDVCGVDYSAYGMTEWQTRSAPNSGFGRGVDRSKELEFDEEKRFAAVYHLLSVSNNQRLRVRAYVNTERPIVPSVIGIWRVADWFEREAFDLYGILFDGHPDLRRILTDYGFIGHPFRKDFPLIGHVEMRYDPEQARVIYEPVSSVEPRTLVPRVARDDNRYAREESQQQAAEDASDA